MIEPQVRDVAHRLVPGREEPCISSLSDGALNGSFRVQRDGRAYVLRLPARRRAPGLRALAALGVDRAWECRVLRAASAAGIAPAVVACEPAAGILVTEWLDGEMWSAAMAADAGSQPAVAQLLHRVQGLQPETPLRRMTVQDWCRLYREALPRSGKTEADREALDRAESQAGSALQEYSRLPEPSMFLCHSDLHRLNLLHAGGRLWLVDWEYAHLGDPFWDLAGWARSASLGPAALDVWVAACLQREPLPVEQDRLRCLMQIYDYVCLLWSLLAGL